MSFDFSSIQGNQFQRLTAQIQDSRISFGADTKLVWENPSLGPHMGWNNVVLDVTEDEFGRRLLTLTADVIYMRNTKPNSTFFLVLRPYNTGDVKGEDILFDFGSYFGPGNCQSTVSKTVGVTTNLLRYAHTISFDNAETSFDGAGAPDCLGRTLPI